jgi:glutamate N-acetyltransferase/amino-acid N-acetyltransferase
MCALGYSGAAFVPEDVQLSFGPIKAFAEGLPLDFDEHAAHDLLDTPEVDIRVDLGAGSSSAVAWTCDFSCEYVRINAEYRT